MRLLPPEFGRVLIVVPTAKEARAVLDGLGASARTPVPATWERYEADARFSVVVCGIGKANAAGAASRALSRGAFDAVICVGIAGALDGSLPLGATVVGILAVFADEGLDRPGGFDSVEAIGFPMTPAGMNVPSDDRLVRALASIGDAAGTIATVSTCSGTDARAREIRARTGAIAEAMEGAAAGLACVRMHVPFVELRVISNTTGDRANQRWDLGLALSRLGGVISRL